MSPEPESGDEGEEGPGTQDTDWLREGETEVDNVVAADEAEAHLAAAAGAAAAPAAAAVP